MKMSEQNNVLQEFLTLLQDEIKASYRELIQTGPLAMYFTLVEGGITDGAQMLTNPVRDHINNFHEKIEELFDKSALIEAIMVAAQNQNEQVTELKKMLDAAPPLIKALREALQAVQPEKEELVPAGVSIGEITGNLVVSDPQGILKEETVVV
jgi:hypothetical protein